MLFALTALAAGTPAAPAESVEFRLPAGEALERAAETHGLRHAEGGVALYDHLLVEDDGPGISTDAPFLKTDRSPTFRIAGAQWAKKLLHLQRAEALAARLYVPRGVAVRVNGTLLPADPNTVTPEVPVALLRAGDNEVVLSAGGEQPRDVKIAPREEILRRAPERKGRPARSFISADGGKTWQMVDGEFMVRLHLVRYAPEGVLVSPVLDLWTREGGGPLAVPATVSILNVAAEAEMPAGTRVEFSVRTGSTPVYDEEAWGRWRKPGAGAPAGHRYAQWRAVFKSDHPTVTPLLKAVSLEAKVVRQAPPAWLGGVKVSGWRGEEIRATSIPFEYEDPMHPRMAALRKKYRLEEVVAGGKTEFEKQRLLRGWVSRQWKWHPVEANYPAWDADEILTRKDGFCVQFAVAFMQCAISLGWQTRFVFGSHPGSGAGGHEVCEVWSNDYRKWVVMDPNQDEHYVDPTSGEPLSMLETHDRLLRNYYPGGKAANWENRPAGYKASPEISVRKGPDAAPWEPEPGKWPDWTHWLHIKYMPRNNFYAHPLPAPRAQGFHWDWPDYWCWTDAQTPIEWQYHSFVGRRSDLEWTLNQVVFDAAPGAAPGEIRVQMGTFTPGFETFLVRRDGQAWEPAGKSLAWKLHAGRNRLEMRVRAKMGVLGPVSFLEVACALP